MISEGDVTGWAAVKESRRKAAMEAFEVEIKKALERKVEIARCRAVFKEAYRSKKIYAIEYIYRVTGWSLPDEKGRCRREYRVQRGTDKPYIESCGFVPMTVAPCGVMVAVRASLQGAVGGDYLVFGASAIDLVDKWNKYIGLEMALSRALGLLAYMGQEGMEGTGAVGAGQRTKSIFSGFIADQRERLRGDIALRDHGDRRGIVTTTARGDTRVEMHHHRDARVEMPGFLNLPYHHNPRSTGEWLGLERAGGVAPSPIIAVEPEPAIIKPGELKAGDVLKITATGSVYREVKK